VRRISVALALVALALIASSAAAQPCGQAVLDDWYDNGSFDRHWGCNCMLDALAVLPEDGRQRLFAAQEATERQLRARCAAGRDVRAASEASARELTEATGEGTSYATDEQPAADAPVEPIVTLALPSRAGGARESGGVDDFVPWQSVIVGMVTGGLLVLIGAAAFRQRGLRP
jgi:hypothetical protein